MCRFEQTAAAWGSDGTIVFATHQLSTGLEQRSRRRGAHDRADTPRSRSLEIRGTAGRGRATLLTTPTGAADLDVAADGILIANGNVVWSPDGLRIAFSSERSGNRDIFERMTGRAVETSLLATVNDEWPEDWSKDGRYLAYGSNSGSGGFADLYALPLFGDREPIQVAHSPYADDEPRFSFDGKWLAYS